MSVQLSDYDFVVLNTSAGKDSQTAMRFVVEQAQREGFPLGRILGAHADLGRSEWPHCADLAKLQCWYHGIRLAKVRRAEDLMTQIEKRGMWPDNGNRYCTSDQKRDQIAKLFTELAGSLPRRTGKPVRILNVMGMRAQESPARAKLQVFSRNERVSSGRRTVDNWMPIHSLTLADVWKDIHESGIPYHYAYDLGMPRLSCLFCFYSPPAALMIAGRHNPEALDAHIGIERRMGHTLRHGFALESVRDAITRGENWGPATDWVM